MLHGQQIDGDFINFALRGINRFFVFEDLMAELEIASSVCMDGAVNSLLSQTTHDQQALFQFVKSLVKTSTRHPNLPVM